MTCVRYERPAPNLFTIWRTVDTPEENILGIPDTFVHNIILSGMPALRWNKIFSSLHLWCSRTPAAPRAGSSACDMMPDLRWGLIFCSESNKCDLKRLWNDLFVMYINTLDSFRNYMAMLKTPISLLINGTQSLQSRPPYVNISTRCQPQFSCLRNTHVFIGRVCNFGCNVYQVGPYPMFIRLWEDNTGNVSYLTCIIFSNALYKVEVHPVLPPSTVAILWSSYRRCRFEVFM